MCTPDRRCSSRDVWPDRPVAKRVMYGWLWWIPDLSALVTAKSEALEVEYKSWIDTSVAEASAKLARHLAALSNHGGGYLIFGVDDKTKVPEGATTLDPKLFGEDAISAIVKRYLDPRFQCRVEWAEFGGASYPVVIVPSHGARPVITIADGPPDQKGRPTGIREGTLYIRSAGAEALPFAARMIGRLCWSGVCDIARTFLRASCGRRSDHLPSRLLRQSTSSRPRPGPRRSPLRRKSVTSCPKSRHRIKIRVREMADNFAVLGYALLGEDGGPLRLENLRSLNARADVGMHQYAYIGWNSFLPLHVPERGGSSNRAPSRRRSFLS